MATAEGSLTGYLFQFEKALCLLAALENENDYVSIEAVDDVSSHKFNDNSVICVVQSKHSISPSGSTFSDTSYSLWRTIETWIEGIQKGEFTEETKFICSTNKKIESNSLLAQLKTLSFDDVQIRFNDLLKKLTEKEMNTHVSKIINKIGFSLKNANYLKIVIENLEVHDQESLKDDFFNLTFLKTEYLNETQRNDIYDLFYGWIVNRAKWQWKNSKKSKIHKREFDNKFYLTFSNSTIVNAIFRTKKKLDSLNLVDSSVYKKTKTELFVRQIEEIDRNPSAKERIIKECIIDFIYHDNELSRIIDEGLYTSEDFNEFVDSCFKEWQNVYDTIVTLSPDSYSEKVKNEKAIEIFNRIILDTSLSYFKLIKFNPQNQYFRNGCFLKLSNIPKLGWHPDWEIKYKP